MSGGGTAPKREHRGIAAVLVVVGTLFAFLTIGALWINRQALDTNNWTNTSSRLLEDKAIRTAVSGYLVDQLYANVDVAGEIRSALPAQAKPLAPTAAGALRGVAQDATDQLLQRPRVQQLWENANRNAHAALLQVIKGGGTTVSTKNGTVVLDLGAVLRQVADRTGVGAKLVAKLPPDAARLTILRSDQLKTAQDIGNALRPLAIVLFLLTIACYAGAIALARGARRETLRAVGFGFVAAGLIALMAARIAGDQVTSSLASTESVRPAINHTWTIGTSLLREAAWASVIYGIVIVFAAWLAGPTRAGVSTRRALAPWLREPRYAWGGTAIIVALVLWWGPTPATRKFLPALLLVALFAAGVAVLRRQTAREFPDAPMPDLGASLRRGAERLRPRHAAEPATETANGDPLERLERLAELHDRGALTDPEYEAAKQDLLAAR